MLILTHGGAGSPAEQSDGPERAADGAATLLRMGYTVLDAVCAAVADLEDDRRFNAGTGSVLRADGKTIEMDAACMDSNGGFGAVACLRMTRNPVAVARRVLDTNENLLCGPGAELFARAAGFAPHDPLTQEAKDAFDRSWRKGDTVGAVGTDGLGHFAAALSSGGITGCPLGRVGDVPVPGAGLWAGPHGAVACTGDGDEIIRRRAAIRIYEMLERGETAQAAFDAAMGWFPENTLFGVLILGYSGSAAGSNRRMAWGKAPAPERMEDA